MKPLSKNQLITLNILIKEAFEYQQRHHATDDLNVHEWRHEQCAKCVGQPRLSKCNNSHYRKLKAHFEVMAGRGSFNNIILAGTPTTGSAPDDTYQNRQIKVKLIFDSLLEHGRRMTMAGKGEQCITAVYVETIARSKFKLAQVDLHKLTARQLDQLLYTVRNRMNAKEGRGDAAKRNKSQRTKKAPQLKLNTPPTPTPPKPIYRPAIIGNVALYN